jgi:ribonuclease HI
MAEVLIYTDGGARGNPGPAACAAVIMHGGKTVEAKKYLGDARTNNQAEYEGLLLGLSEAKRHRFAGHTVEVRMDSELIVKQMRGEYKVKDAGLKPLHAHARELLSAFPHVRFVHVPREENAEADRLVNEAIDEAGR